MWLVNTRVLAQDQISHQELSILPIAAWLLGLTGMYVPKGPIISDAVAVLI